MRTAVNTQALRDCLLASGSFSDEGLTPFFTGETVIDENSSANSFFVIEEGKLDVLRGTPLRKFAEVGPGELVGEGPIIHRGSPRTARVRAKTKCVLRKFSTKSLTDDLPHVTSGARELLKLRLHQRVTDFIENEREPGRPDITLFRVALRNIFRSDPKLFDKIIDGYDGQWIDLFCGAEGRLVDKLSGLGFPRVSGIDREIDHLSNKLGMQGDVICSLCEVPSASVSFFSIVNFLQEENLYLGSERWLNSYSFFPQSRLKLLAEEIERTLKPGGTMLVITGDKALDLRKVFANVGLGYSALLPDESSMHLFSKAG